ncbi:unnamed protein product [Protopolystoma xenopodis]|uniref:Uncharacterized protein n=1 Tax=Protopolystoma xenopodis TaxID=117903 RepID=A0A3S5A4N3_9PLAT|nr:unnamed protein product [Protopolystoma xenopodis]
MLKCFGLLRFESAAHARRWLEIDKVIRQPDFLGSVDIFMLPLKKSDMTNRGYPIIQLISLHITFLDIYVKQYLTKMEEAVKLFGGIPHVVCHQKPWTIRGNQLPGSIIINQWPDFTHFLNYKTSGECRL